MAADRGFSPEATQNGTQTLGHCHSTLVLPVPSCSDHSRFTRRALYNPPIDGTAFRNETWAL